MQREDPENTKRRHEAHVERLIREGRMEKYGSGTVPAEFLDLPLTEDPDGLIPKALPEDRRNGR